MMTKRNYDRAESDARDISSATRRGRNPEETTRIVLDGMSGEQGIAEQCHRESINPNPYYRCRKEFLSAGKKRLTGDVYRRRASKMFLRKAEL